MNDFKVINLIDTLHIADFQVKHRHYEVYFSAVRSTQDINFSLPKDLTLSLNSCYETYRCGLYLFDAADDALFLFYHSILRILIERFKGFSVRQIYGGKNYVIKTPAYCPAALL